MMDVSFAGNESPPIRSTVLGFGASFLRGRPRAASQVDNNAGATSPALNNSPPLPDINVDSSQARSPSATGHRRRGANNNNTNPSPPTATQNNHNPPPTPTDATAPSSSPSLSLSMLRRRRSAGGANANANMNQNSPATTPINRAVTNPVLSSPTPGASHRIRLVPHLDSRRTLRFDPICRHLKEGDTALRVGRFTDRSGLGLAAANALSSNKLAFKSKVVSRAHAEIWVETGGKFFIKDTKSSSGTFLNHVRLSPANSESRPHQIKDGDILQLGVDYQGGTEDMYKSVKIRIEVGREWQAAANAFNTNALNQLKSLAVSLNVESNPPVLKRPASKTAIPDCCICLFGVNIRQALFIAPCSHAFHYKCIRPLLEAHHSAFSCPLCRTFADLEEDVEVEVDVEAKVDGDAEAEQDPSGDGSGSAGEGETGPPRMTPPSSISPRTRDRSPGAETEVEVDGNGSMSARLGMQRSRTRVHQGGSQMHTVIDLTEPGQEDSDELRDTEMMDAIPDHNHSRRVSFEDADGMDAVRSTSMSPDPGNGQTAGGGQGFDTPRAGTSGNTAGAGADTSEGEGSGGSAEGVAMDADNGNGSGGEGANGDLAVGGKRKR